MSEVEVLMDSNGDAAAVVVEGDGDAAAAASLLASKEDSPATNAETTTAKDSTTSGAGTDYAAVYEWLKHRYETVRLRRSYRLVTETDVLSNSILSVRFATMCAAINTKMLNPNYPIMVTPGAHPDSFPDTEPFDFNSATYFLPMCSLLGVAIASIFLGQISDKVGRKRVILVLSLISAVGSVVKYFTSATFWGFCITQFIFGFFLGNLPVAMAYVGDVYTSKKKKEQELGILVSFYVMGNSGGGIIAILMNATGLFSPLWVGAGLMVVAAVGTSWYMVEAGDERLLATTLEDGDGLLVGGDEEEEPIRPEVIDKKALWNIVLGAVFDNFGSTGLFPLCLSPLAIDRYLLDFVNAEPPEDPIMSIIGYQWLSVMVAGMVVPSTFMTPTAFRKFGVAGTCVMGNVMTAIVTLALLLIGNAPATSAYFGAFVFIMYAGFPFTVFSQLTTGPMLDVIAPKDKIGYVQGLNNASMNVGMAIAPWIFGLLADATTTNLAISVAIGVSCLAAAINLPLTCDKRFGRVKAVPDSSKRVLPTEDSEFIEMALAGEFVDQERLVMANLERMKAHKAYIVPHVRSYAEDKEKGLYEIQSQAGEAFEQRLAILDRVLMALQDPEKERTTEEVCSMLNAAVYGHTESMNEATNDLGQWVGDYLQDAGYNPHTTSTLVKQMIMTALPPISYDKKYTPDNLEHAILRGRHVYKKYAEHFETVEKEKEWSFSDALGKGSTAVFYS